MIGIRVMLRIKKVTKKVRVNFRVRVSKGQGQGANQVQNDEQGQDHPRVILGA